LRISLPSSRSSVPGLIDEQPQIWHAKSLNEGRLEGGGIDTPAPANMTNLPSSKAILILSGNLTLAKIISYDVLYNSWPEFFHGQSFRDHFRRGAEFWRDARGDVIERRFLGGQPVGTARRLRGLDGGLKIFAQRFGARRR
jgi:hypothetical protein